MGQGQGPGRQDIFILAHLRAEPACHVNNIAADASGSGNAPVGFHRRPHLIAVMGACPALRAGEACHTELGTFHAERFK